MPLPRLPTSDGRRIRGGPAGACVSISADARETALPFTPSAAGGKHKRGFCAECGSRITGGESGERATDWVGVTAGSLDDPSWFRPQMDFFVSDAQPWDQMDGGIPKYEYYPPAPGTKK